MTTLSLYKRDFFTSEELSNYSRFKHGSKSTARRYGKDLAEIVSSVIHPHQSYIVYGAPYKNVPTASSALKDYMVSYLAKDLHFKSISLRQSKIERAYSYDSDYGKMSKEERRNAISSDIFYIDKNFINPEDILIFVDDIKITGSHEERIIEVLEREGITNECIFVYAYEYMGMEPSIEHELNHNSVNGLIDINNIIVNDEFIFNTRVIKYILRAETLQFVSFISYQSDAFLETLYSYSVLNAYHCDDKYTLNLNILRDTLTSKRIINA